MSDAKRETEATLAERSLSAPDESPASVLLAFRASNARSFREEMELSLVASNMAEPGCVRSVRWREGGSPVKVLPAIGLFGANGSGKSNVLKVMSDLRSLVLSSFHLGDPGGGIIRYEPFKLDPERREEPSRYEIDLVLDGIRHQYGVVVTAARVVEEFAYWYPKGRPAALFVRHGDRVDLGSTERSKGRAVTELLRPNALFLSTAALANHGRLLPLYQWFGRNLMLAEAESRPFRQLFTAEMLNDPRRKPRVLALLRAADLGVSGTHMVEIDPILRDRMERAVRILAGREGDPDPEEALPFEQLGVGLTHSTNRGDVNLDPADESLGTRVWFGLVGPVVHALETGAVLLADELDASLHPHLAEQLVGLFQSPETNPKRAQLIFNAHDVTLLGDAVGKRLLGRDQIWFTEKTSNGQSRLFPLTAEEPRKQEAVSKRYLEGRYGATPLVSSMEFAAATLT